MNRLFRASHRDDPEISIEEYSRILKTAIERRIALLRSDNNLLVAVFNSSPTDPVMTEDRPLGLMSVVSQDFDRLNHTRLEFENVKPDNRLSDLHFEMVKMFRSQLEVINKHANLVRTHFGDSVQDWERAQRDSRLASDVMERVDDKVSKAMRKVQDRYPSLLPRLGLPDTFYWMMDLDDIIAID